MSKTKITHPGILDYYKDNLKPLALYYKIKHTHKNSVVYNWNYHKISRNLNVSYYLAKKYTNILIQEGIAFERDNHLVFMSMNKLYKHIHRTPASNGWQYVNVTHNSGISEV